MKHGWIFAVILVTGCASSVTGPAPMFYNGNYYLAGDPACVAYRGHQSLRKIMCFDAGNQATGIRDPMSDQQLVMHQQAAQVANQPIYVPQMAPMTPPPVMTIPQVTPLQGAGGNRMKCISAGIYVNCRY